MSRIFRWFTTKRQSTWFRWGFDVLLVLTVFTGVGLWQTREHVRGDLPVDHPFELLSGGNMALSSLRGKPVLVAFWAPWCTVCQGESANLSWLKSHAADSVEVVSVAMSFESRDEVQRFVQANQVNFPVLLADEAVASQFRVRAYPTVYFLDSNGRIKNSVVGYSTTAGLWLRAVSPFSF
jgi:thiol-disulfide isomerase/thioredoxin